MKTKLTQQSITQTNWLAIIIATAIWWIVPPFVFYGQPHSDDPPLGLAIACIIGFSISITICAQLRMARWIVLIWAPMLIWASLGAISVFIQIAQEPHGGPDAAPLEGVADLIGIVIALMLGGAAILCLIWRPRVYSMPLLILAIVNTAAISVVTDKSYRQATRQEMFLHVLDSKGNPLPGASVRYTRYGYGPGGTDVFDTDGGPIVSDKDGVAVIPSRLMRYKTNGKITKPGFREIGFVVDMQFSKWDQKRGVRVSTLETPDIARGSIPTAEPVAFSLYLPPESDAPDRLHPLKRIETKSNIGTGSQAAHVLNIETGKFTNGPEGDIRFDVFFELEEGQYKRTRLRIAGVNGAKVSQVPPEVTFSGSLAPYENIFRIAPQNGYQDEIVIQHPGNLPGPMVYVSARGGHLFARLTIDQIVEGKDEANAECYLHYFVNPNGGRNLE